MHRALSVLLFVTFAALGVGALRQAQSENEDMSAVATKAVVAPATPVLSARRIPDTLAAPVADNRLRAAVQPFLDATPGQECLVVSVGGRRIVQVDATTPLLPASNQKLLVSVAALAELGPDTTMTTTAAAAGAPAGGVIVGDLYLIGGGDPLLTTASFRAGDDPPKPNTALEDLADQVVAAGVTEIHGAVIGDDSRYDDNYDVDAWPNRTLAKSRPGALTALAVNRGFSEWPTSPDDPDSPVVAENPPVSAAAAFTQLLTDRGVAVGGEPGRGVAPADVSVLGSIESLPVGQIIDEMNVYSDNTTAELLVKEIGHHRSGEGSTEAGTAAVRGILADLGYQLDGVEVLDGSGLANDRVTCDLLAGILERTGRDSTLADGLPVAGESGTLRARFRSTEAVGRLRAKSGFLNQATALSGFVDTLGGSVVTFSFIANDDFVSQEEVNLQEQLAAVLVNYPQGVDLALLEPIAATG